MSEFSYLSAPKSSRDRLDIYKFWYDVYHEEMKRKDTLPIFAGSPPVAEGLLTQRAVLCLIDKEHPPYAAILPPIPNIYIYDAAQLSGAVYFSDGEIKNKLEIENFNNLNKR
ncbi:hypothetical protein PSI22_01005 [Xenorhabdus sp. XENO-7]|uniref:Uncharacterized protein n=1 Tax=Xenorhabdus aichiensis TaxID=3025874 RepID=A0ABT5LXT2_9GAMM|nr:hypothetical protein [Xenorhabdus aichiensis]MDC9620242.1 hypothetical protein [Xenorhabdus aichiensis]